MYVGIQFQENEVDTTYDIRLFCFLCLIGILMYPFHPSKTLLISLGRKVLGSALTSLFSITFKSLTFLEASLIFQPNILQPKEENHEAKNVH